MDICTTSWDGSVAKIEMCEVRNAVYYSAGAFKPGEYTSDQMLFGYAAGSGVSWKNSSASMSDTNMRNAGCFLHDLVLHRVSAYTSAVLTTELREFFDSIQVVLDVGERTIAESNLSQLLLTPFEIKDQLIPKHTLVRVKLRPHWHKYIPGVVTKREPFTSSARKLIHVIAAPLLIRTENMPRVHGAISRYVVSVENAASDFASRFLDAINPQSNEPILVWVRLEGIESRSI